jgi:hypothetical protein
LPALTLALVSVLTACGGGAPGGTTTPTPPATTYSATAGIAQKGALAVGSSVSARELGLNLSATGNLYTYATTSADGAFTPDTKFLSPLLAVTATGIYADEVTGAPSDGPVTLQAYANLNTETVLGVNLLTTLAYTRINTLLNAPTGALAFADARAQAEREVLAAFGIATGAPLGAFGSLRIGAAGATDGDVALAALSSVVVQGRAAAEVNALIGALQADIGAHGAITDPANARSLSLSAQALNLDTVAARLAAQYGTPFDAGALAQWIDQDGDGVIARNEFRVDSAVATATDTSTFTLPADFVAAHAGAALTVSAGQLWTNGAPAVAGATLHAADTLMVVAPSRLADGALRTYVQVGTTPIARVTFVKGLAAIAVTPATGTLPVGISQRFVATGTFADGSTHDVSGAVTWSSSVPAVADIDTATGLADALATGDTTIAATSGAVTGALALKAVQATIQSMVIAPATLQTGVGITRHLKASGTYSDGSVRDVSATATWAADTAGIASASNGAISGLALGTTGVTATIGTVSAHASVAVTTDTWTAAPAMPTERVAGHTATLLPGGKLLMAGGVKSEGAGITAADLFDPVAATWTTVAPTNVMRSSHTATLLADGRLLVVGGSTVSSATAKGYVNNASAEIYDPVANTWTATPPMSTARSHHSATLLPDGTVLVFGGEDVNYLPSATAEIFDPVANTWALPRTLPISPRSQHTATLLPSGLVLIAGGFDIIKGALTPLLTTELYDPVLHVATTTTPNPDGTTTTVTVTTGKDFTAGTVMAFAHYGHTTTLLPDGHVLVVGGNTTQTELYDPTAATWATQGATGAAHTSHGTVLLPNGQVLIVGGTQFAQPAAERHAPAAGLWSPAGTMLVLRANPTATLLQDGSVMVCGGFVQTPDTAASNCETYW